MGEYRTVARHNIVLPSAEVTGISATIVLRCSASSLLITQYTIFKALVDEDLDVSVHGKRTWFLQPWQQPQILLRLRNACTAARPPADYGKPHAGSVA